MEQLKTPGTKSAGPRSGISDRNRTSFREREKEREREREREREKGSSNTETPARINVAVGREVAVGP